MKENKVEETKDVALEEKKIKEDTSEANSDTKETKTDDNSKDSETYDIPFIDPTVYSYKKKRHVKRYIFGGIIGLLLVVYFTGVLYFHLHFGTYTTITVTSSAGIIPSTTKIFGIYPNNSGVTTLYSVLYSYSFS